MDGTAKDEPAGRLSRFGVAPTQQERRKDGHMSDDFNQSLDDSAPTCPTCLRTRELAGEIWDLHWICDCGVTPIDPKSGTGPTGV